MDIISYKNQNTKKYTNPGKLKIQLKKFIITRLLILLILLLTFGLLSSCTFIEDLLNQGKKNNQDDQNGDTEELPYKLIDEWKLDYPVWGITSDIDGNIYAMIDEGGIYCIYKYDESGTFLGRWYISDAPPEDISAWTKVIITESGTIKSYYPNGTPISSQSISIQPWGLLAGKDGYTYILGYDYDSSDLPLVRKYNSTGVLIKEWVIPIIGNATSLDISSDNNNNILVLYLSYLESYKAGVMIYSSEGDFIREWDVSNFPDYIASDDKGYSYVICQKIVNYEDYYSVRKFDSYGRLVNEWEIPVYPNGITVTENGNVYVSIYNSDTGYQGILVFSNKE